MKLYYVCAIIIDTELDTFSVLRPENVLLSYHYWKDYPGGFAAFWKHIGYEPNIMLDSGAFSADSQGVEISIPQYERFIDKNLDEVEIYIGLDDLKSPERSMQNHERMIRDGYIPVPVFHWGEDDRWLRQYVDAGETLVGLGGTVPVADKKRVGRWVGSITGRYPKVEFHHFGSSTETMIVGCPDVRSSDSSSWTLQTAFGFPQHLNLRGNQDVQDRYQRFANWYLNRPKLEPKTIKQQCIIRKRTKLWANRKLSEEKRMKQFIYYLNRLDRCVENLKIYMEVERSVNAKNIPVIRHLFNFETTAEEANEETEEKLSREVILQEQSSLDSF